MPEGVFAATVLQLRAELAAMTGRYAGRRHRRARRAAGPRPDARRAVRPDPAVLPMRWPRSAGAILARPGELTAGGLAEYGSPMSGRYIWPVLWLAARAEADEATRARDRREEIPDGTAARYQRAGVARRGAGHAQRLVARLPGAGHRGTGCALRARPASPRGRRRPRRGRRRPSPIRWRTPGYGWPRRPRRRATGRPPAVASARPTPWPAGSARRPSRTEAAALARRTRLSLDEPDGGRGPSGGRGSAGPVRADRARAGDPAAAGRGPVQPPDRRGPVHQPEDGQRARVQHPGQARGGQPGRGGRGSAPPRRDRLAPVVIPGGPEDHDQPPGQQDGRDDRDEDQLGQGCGQRIAHVSHCRC